MTFSGTTWKGATTGSLGHSSDERVAEELVRGAADFSSTQSTLSKTKALFGKELVETKQDILLWNLGFLRPLFVFERAGAEARPVDLIFSLWRRT